MTDRDAALAAALAAQAPALAAVDAAIAAAGLAIWVGAEPTYTRRESSDPWWLGASDPLDAGAADKRARAAAMAIALARVRPGLVAYAALGRHFPDEHAPRFCYAVDAPAATWHGTTICALAPDDPEIAALVAAPAAGDRPAPGTLTITPDPGVVEVNMAPCPDLATFAAQLAAIDRAAHAAGLAPLRYRYNGDVVDSGGGGQLTLGGPTPAESPFVTHPALLPRLLRYVHNHPSLSYWFLGECAGSASQSPRPDEGVRERYDELPLACAELERLAARGTLDGATLWASLAPLLVDAAGNSHRAELNIEKLWSPHDGGRGQLGLVEWRAFRMPAHPTALCAAAALVRAVAARCALAPYEPAWIDWGAALHDRWALPSELAADLDAVLVDLAQHGLDLAPLARDLHAFRAEAIARVTVHDGLRLSLHRAVEFWPLVGDVASQERATARLVDPSSERLELIVETDPAAPPPMIVVAGRAVEVPANVAGARHLGIRRRQYVPNPGLHPTIGADEPLAIAVGDDAAAVELRWFAWRPEGGPYPGLPTDDADAAARRAERLQVVPIAAPPAAAHRATVAGRTLDVRAWRGEDP